MESELVHLTPATVALYHRNPRLGNVAAIADSLRAHGQYKPVVVNRGTHTGRPMEVLAGNHTVKAFRDLAERYPSDPRWQLLAAYVIDVDDDRAARIVLVDNRSPELGTYDNAVLVDVLEGLGDDLTGTGYTEDDLSDMLAGIEELVTGTGRDEGLIPNMDLEQKADNYTDTATRVVVLQYAINQFIWMQDKLTAIREEHSFENNAQAMLMLVEQYVGETVPAPTEDGTDDDAA